MFGTGDAKERSSAPVADRAAGRVAVGGHRLATH
jgi:hypothetical protein